MYKLPAESLATFAGLLIAACVAGTWFGMPPATVVMVCCCCALAAGIKENSIVMHEKTEKYVLRMTLTSILATALARAS